MRLELTEDEALVLFELLANYDAGTDARVLKIQHPAERNALWSVQAALERHVVAPFQQTYEAQLDAARARLVAAGGGW